jgi:hypothetical protein
VKLRPWIAIAALAGTLGGSGAAQTNDTDVFPVLSIGGENLTNVTIWSVNPACATIFYRGGAKQVPLGDLPEFLQKRYGYDPAKAEAFQTAARAEQKAESARQAAEWMASDKARRAADWPEWRGPNRDGTGISTVRLAD